METMATALRRYFDESGFGEDGGYASDWVDFKLGPLPFPLPNTEARKRAVRFHDLHHVLTGYRTDLTGEFEISAWEIGAGCGDFHAAWVLNLSGMAGGLLTAPVRTWRAFVRGLDEQSTYGRDYEALLERNVEDLRAELGIGAGPHRAGLGAALRFAAAITAGAVVGSLMMLVLVSPITLALWWRGRRAKAQALAAAP
ncbi:MULTISPECIES: hypothetical protein [Myxococcus]|uniref:hypothetical protein n=1 Tax=Myxococcus TaxID=32 RepID=UPI001142E33F|nr:MULTISPECIES: hypothetical protein [Myxococcus]NOK07041.1 hypothetical protein [Myxococcus xanthus]